MKRIVQNRKTIIASLCAFGALAVGLAVWFFGNNSPNDLVNLGEQEVPLGNFQQISQGDVVVVSIFADEMDSVYGYQFEINYDENNLEYTKRLYSNIEEIDTIFATIKEQYLLVGATMLGNSVGYTGQSVLVCQMEFTALANFSSEQITLSGVNIVSDDMQYTENIGGWTASITIRA